MINDLNVIDRDIILLIAKNIKRLNIVTNHIDRFGKIQNYLYNEFGVMLNVSNNKKTSLLKAKVIINVDFTKELLNQYNIYDKAIVVNILEKVPINRKKFSGININYFKIAMPKIYKQKEFDDEIIYESIILKHTSLTNIRSRITKDKIKIKKLIGNNGPIRECEIE